MGMGLINPLLQEERCVYCGWEGLIFAPNGKAVPLGECPRCGLMGTEAHDA
jgi:hypothetical protein